MKAILSYFAFFILILAAASCNKVIDLKLNNETGKLVIDANITYEGGPQVIKLTTNVPFSGTNTYPPVTGAQVSVTDQVGISHMFTEVDSGIYSSISFEGIPKYTYTMSVITGGKTYTAVSTMPKVVVLDSIAASESDFDSSKGKKKITAYFQDPGDEVNQYKFDMYVNGVQVKRVIAVNDDFNNGKYVSLNLWEDDIDIYAGDDVAVTMECIDKPVYTYWYTLSQQGGNGPGGGVTPSNPPTNITPAVLGYFSAHTTQLKTITVH